MTIAPLTLSGRVVRLEPLLLSHHDQLVAAANDGALWNLPYTIVPSQESMAAYIERAHNMQEQSRELPFAIVHASTMKVIGSTRYLNDRKVGNYSSSTRRFSRRARSLS